MKFLRLFIQATAVLTLIMSLFFGASVQTASADDGGGTTGPFTPVSVSLSGGNARAYFEINSCNNGRCFAADSSTAGQPFRPWQNFAVLTTRAAQTTVTGADGKPVTWFPGGSTICFMVPEAETVKAGGANKYFVAYWDDTLDNCDHDWNKEGPNGSSLCKKAVKGNWYILPNTSRTVEKFGTYTVCGYLMKPANFALVVMK